MLTISFWVEANYFLLVKIYYFFLVQVNQLLFGCPLLVSQWLAHKGFSMLVPEQKVSQTSYDTIHFFF